MELLLDRFHEWLFPSPRGCPICGRRLKGYAVCRICRSVYANDRACMRCGRETDKTSSCSECRSGVFAFQAAQAVGRLTGRLRQAVLRFKYGHLACLAEPLAEWMSEEVRLPLADIICFVPADRIRQRLRGYNAAELLARALAMRLAVPCQPLLRRSPRQLPPQQGSNYEERWRQVSGLYQPTNFSLKGMTLWVVDDVLTTGATLSACAQALYARGAASVYGLALATTPRQLSPDKPPAPVDFEQLWI